MNPGIHAATAGRPFIRGRRRQSGSTLLETCAALALSAAVALAVLSGVRPLSCAFRVESARSTLMDAMLEARRNAYEGDANVSVETRAGSNAVVLRPPGVERRLGDGVTLASVPADGQVEFRASGLADNATVAVACAGSTASVVVNQRGVVR